MKVFTPSYVRPVVHIIPRNNMRPTGEVWEPFEVFPVDYYFFDEIINVCQNHFGIKSEDFEVIEIENFPEEIDFDFVELGYNFRGIQDLAESVEHNGLEEVEDFLQYYPMERINDLNLIRKGFFSCDEDFSNEILIESGADDLGELAVFFDFEGFERDLWRRYYRGNNGYVFPRP